MAAPCGMGNMQILRIADMDRYLDFWNLMVSDYLHMLDIRKRG